MAQNANVTVNVNVENIGELKGLLAQSRRDGLKRVIIKVPVRLFAIDTKYQTPVRTERDMNYLVNNWDDNRLLPIVVVPHDEEGLFYIVDGYGRWKASQRVNPVKYEEMECLVILCAPAGEEARRKFEAEQYAFQNRNVAPIKPYQKHGAGLVLDDEPTKLLEAMSKEYGFKFSQDKGYRSVNVIGSYPACLGYAKMYGVKGLDYIFGTIHDVAWDRQNNGYSRYVTNAFKDMFKLYPRRNNMTRKQIVEILRGVSPLQFKCKAVAKYPMLSTDLACSMWLEDMLVEANTVHHTRHVENGKVVNVAN